MEERWEKETISPRRITTEKFRAYAAYAKGEKLEPFEFDPGPLHDEHVEIKVHYCGICGSDISMLDNQWGQTSYPLVPGHEIVGTIVAAGDHVRDLVVGERVGLGWFSESCLACLRCLSGDHNLCPNVEQTIVHRHGGFADRVRCHWLWAAPVPPEIKSAEAGPLFCAGITVFNPIVQFGVKPTHRVGVIGIGGLGHLAVQFLNKWGCEVYAFTSSDSKRDEAKKLGAHHVVNSRDPKQLEKIESGLDFIISTIPAALDWSVILKTLGPKGRLHFVGVATDPLGISAFDLIEEQRSVSGSPSGSPATMRRMLEFCERHDIAPIVEVFPMSHVNGALDHMRSGKAHYRIVLENDFE